MTDIFDIHNEGYFWGGWSFVLSGSTRYNHKVHLQYTLVYRCRTLGTCSTQRGMDRCSLSWGLLWLHRCNFVLWLREIFILSLIATVCWHWHWRVSIVVVGLWLLNPWTEVIMPVTSDFWPSHNRPRGVTSGVQLDTVGFKYGKSDRSVVCHRVEWF